MRRVTILMMLLWGVSAFAQKGFVLDSCRTIDKKMMKHCRKFLWWLSAF